MGTSVREKTVRRQDEAIEDFYYRQNFTEDSKNLHYLTP